MTEDEAKTKWCPMVRMATIVPELKAAMPPHNRMNLLLEAEPEQLCCIGSDCMMWKLLKPVFVESQIAAGTYEYERFDGGGDCGLKT